jgi:hypothetical protein
MARFRSTQSFYVDGAAVGKVQAGRTIADSQANAQPGDVVWVGLNSQSLPAGMVPLDSSATTMRNASQWANTPISATILGVDSIGG